MVYPRTLLTLVAVTVVICTVTAAPGKKSSWREKYDISAFTKDNPKTQRILEGPIGDLVDVIVEILIYVVDLILGGDFVRLSKFEELKSQMKELRELLMAGK